MKGSGCDMHICGGHHKCNTDMDIHKITYVLGFILVFMAVELWGHFRTKSLSLLADALHLMVDISGLLVSIVTLWITKWHATDRMPWGYHRAEILGAMVSVIFIWAAVGYLMIESFHKYIRPSEIDGNMFFVIAVMGLVVNLVCLWIMHRKNPLHKQPRTNLNIRATYVHIIGDVIQSLGVILTSVIIYFNPKLVIADIMCTCAFAILVLFSTFSIMKDGIGILMEGAPRHISKEEISNFILKEDAVVKIIDLRMWSIGVNRPVICMKILADHLLIREYEGLLEKIQTYLKEYFEEDCIIIQIDTPNTNRSLGGGLVVGGTTISAPELKDNAQRSTVGQ